MNSKIKLSVVSYLNSKPFIFGLEKPWMKEQIELELDIPSVCAMKLLSGKVDVGLVPIAILPELKEYYLLTDYCIGANGDVNSVLLVSEVPLESISRVLLDYQSRTSVLLARVLAKRFWKINPIWEAAEAGYESTINGSSAGVIIGDRALIMKDQFKYVYDLSGEWKKYTGLPFVFACWVANKPVSKTFSELLNKAAAEGVTNIPAVLNQYGSGEIENSVAEKYLSESIDFNFNEQKKKALELFLSYIEEFTESKLKESLPH